MFLLSRVNFFKRHKLYKAIIITMYCLVYELYRYNVHDNESTKKNDMKLY